MKILNSLLLILTSAIAGCSTHNDTANHQLYKENKRLSDEVRAMRERNLEMERCHSMQNELLAQEKRNECIMRHNDAKLSCDILYRGEPNSILLQNEIRYCLSNKGFPNGLDDCK